MKPGELLIVPRGTEHRPAARRGEVKLLLIDPNDTPNTGDKATATQAVDSKKGRSDMFSHVMLGCSDRERSKKFYDATMGALGHRQGQDFGKSDWWMTKQGALGIGPPIDGQPCSIGNGSTIGFVAPSPEAVDAWHAAGIANGGTAIEDPPGIRDAGFGKMYLAYLRDPDGNKLCGYYRIPSDQ